LDLVDHCRSLFAGLRREGLGGPFHLPSADGTPRISAWWSAHHSLALRHLDLGLALAELRTLYGACQGRDGLVASDRQLAGREAMEHSGPPGGLRSEDGRSPLIDPPVAAYAAARLVLDGHLEARDVLECATRQLDAIWSERLPPDTGLPVILHPAEAGAWASPLFDSVIDVESPGAWRDEAMNLARSAAACRFDPERALRAGHAFVVEDPGFCGWFLIALEEVRSAWGSLGVPTDLQKLSIRSEMIAEAMAERLWCDAHEIWVGFNRQRQEPLEVVTAAGIVPAAARSLGAQQAARAAVERYLHPGSSPLWGERAVSFNPLAGERQTDTQTMPWRGNCAPAVTQYWAYLALSRAGRSGEARAVRERFERVIEQSGFSEFYDPDSGEALESEAGTGATAATLILEMGVGEDPK
jgi:hypothetical protein